MARFDYLARTAVREPAATRQNVNGLIWNWGTQEFLRTHLWQFAYTDRYEG